MGRANEDRDAELLGIFERTAAAGTSLAGDSSPARDGRESGSGFGSHPHSSENDG
jgi:hypothetical protein